MAYLPPTPALQSVQFTLELPEHPDSPPAILARATGRSAYKRGSLWHEQSTWTHPEDLRNAPADWIHHIALTALQDKPNTQERLLFSLTGGLGMQDPLF